MRSVIVRKTLHACTSTTSSPTPTASPSPVSRDLQTVSQFTMNGQHINDSTPTIKWNLATMGEVDANSVEMRVSGVGLVPANYEPKSKVVTYAFTQKLWPKTYTVWKHAGTSQLIGNKITIYNILHRHPNASRYSLSHYCGSVCNLMSPDLLCSISERLFLPYF
jgi:hypothetical protein